MKDSKTQHRFIELRAQSVSLRAVADKLGIGLQTAGRWERKFKEQIESLNALELEALREKYWLTEKARIERLGGQLLRIRDQLDERDFLDVETPKLLDMELKLYTALSKGDATLVHKTRGHQNEAPHVSFADSPEYKKLRSKMMQVLEPYPKIREEIAQALLEAEAANKRGNDGNGKK
jgi:hypothetical protein